MVTRRSCMASSSAACVFGGVRLISSASSRLVKIGPGLKRKLRAAGRGVLLEHLRAGDVGGHEVGRELDALAAEVERAGQRAGHERLGQAGRADEQAVAAREERDEHLADHVGLADDHARHLRP